MADTLLIQFRDSIDAAKSSDDLSVILALVRKQYAALSEVGKPASDFELKEVVDYIENRRTSWQAAPGGKGSIILEAIRNSASDLSFGLIPATKYHKELGERLAEGVPETGLGIEKFLKKLMTIVILGASVYFLIVLYKEFKGKR